MSDDDALVVPSLGRSKGRVNADHVPRRPGKRKGFVSRKDRRKTERQAKKQRKDMFHRKIDAHDIEAEKVIQVENDEKKGRVAKKQKVLEKDESSDSDSESEIIEDE